ncbi:MAG TPA: hypothetical protein DEO33_03190, partial [Rikenellaceae bacterium]|nr:hypothetical protein [Rikenellaceae bacterium]
MTKRKLKNSLLSAEATGGDIAESGFQYQASLIASRVPYWLKHDGFTEAIQEALGDVEASFFVPERGICREFVEYKNHRLTPSEFWPEIERFWEMDKTSPEAYCKFVLACKDVSDDIKSMLNALRRVRDAYPFYQNASAIQNSSFSDFETIVNNLYQKEDVSNFLFDKVFFEIDLTDAENYAREKFRDALYNCFPELQNFTAKAGSEAFSNVAELIKNRRNKPIHRNDLELAITHAVESNYKLVKNIRLHTRSYVKNCV